MEQAHLDKLSIKRVPPKRTRGAEKLLNVRSIPSSGALGARSTTRWTDAVRASRNRGHVDEEIEARKHAREAALSHPHYVRRSRHRRRVRRCFRRQRAHGPGRHRRLDKPSTGGRECLGARPRSHTWRSRQQHLRGGTQSTRTECGQCLPLRHPRFLRDHHRGRLHQPELLLSCGGRPGVQRRQRLHHQRPVQRAAAVHRHPRELHQPWAVRDQHRRELQQWDLHLSRGGRPVVQRR